MSTPTGTWTEERLSQLRSLLGEGKSAGAVAKIMGLTRNAIMGKAHRMNIAMRAPNDGGVRARTGGIKPKPKSRDFDPNRAIFKPKAAPKPMPVARPVRTAEPSLRLLLMDLNSNDCHWPEGEGPFFFCGNPAEEFKPYCPAHCRAAYQPVKARAV